LPETSKKNVPRILKKDKSKAWRTLSHPNIHHLKIAKVSVTKGGTQQAGLRNRNCYFSSSRNLNRNAFRFRAGFGSGSNIKWNKKERKKLKNKNEKPAYWKTMLLFTVKGQDYQEPEPEPKTRSGTETEPEPQKTHRNSVDKRCDQILRQALESVLHWMRCNDQKST
jgi:hypothetical protein